MKKAFYIFGALWLAAGLCAVVLAAEAKSDATAKIKALEDRYVAAFNAKDINKIMECYELGDDLLVFDVIPPRQYVGAQAYRRDWQGVFGWLTGPVKVEMTELSITGGGNLAYGHNIQHVKSTDKDGKPVEFTLRTTDVYRRINGKWLIVHEHFSVPVDLASGRADLQSKP